MVFIRASRAWLPVQFFNHIDVELKTLLSAIKMVKNISEVLYRCSVVFDVHWLYIPHERFPSSSRLNYLLNSTVFKKCIRCVLYRFSSRSRLLTPESLTTQIHTDSDICTTHSPSCPVCFKRRDSFLHQFNVPDCHFWKFERKWLTEPMQTRIKIPTCFKGG